MGCVSSNSADKDAKNEPEHTDDTPGPAEPKKRDEVSEKYIKLYYDQAGVVEVDENGEGCDLKIDRSKITDTVDDKIKKPKSVKAQSKKVSRPTSFINSEHKKNNNELKPFTSTQKEETTAFLNEIERLADEQGLFGDLGTRQ